jgi:hypothetical protein
MVAGSSPARGATPSQFLENSHNYPGGLDSWSHTWSGTATCSAPSQRGRSRRCRALTSVTLFDLRSNGGIGGLKWRPRPRGTAPGDAKEREQDEENANCSPIVGHRSPIRVSQLATRLCNHFGEHQSAVASLKITSPCSRPYRARPSAGRREWRPLVAEA